MESKDFSVFPPHRHNDGDEMTIIISGALEISTWESLPIGKPSIHQLSDEGDCKAMRLKKLVASN